ncbi:MAG TPA: endonuclease, partial [Chitinophagaceae bacterium]
MKKIFILSFLAFLPGILFAQITMCSWNLENFGKSKNDSTINFIANAVKDFDLIAIQEVVAGEGGSRAIAKLTGELNRKGFKWDYTISDPTVSSSYKTERYAFIWKTAKLALTGKAWLEKKYNVAIDREPYFATFKFEGKFFTVANFHAITKSKQPETEIKY